MLPPVVQEIARVFVAIVACFAVVPVVLIVGAALVRVWPGRRYRGRRRVEDKEMPWWPW